MLLRTLIYEVCNGFWYLVIPQKTFPKPARLRIWRLDFHHKGCHVHFGQLFAVAIAICYFHLLFSFAIFICYFHLLFSFAIFICHLLFSVAICDYAICNFYLWLFYLLLLFVIFICYFCLLFAICYCYLLLLFVIVFTICYYHLLFVVVLFAISTSMCFVLLEYYYTIQVYCDWAVGLFCPTKAVKCISAWPQLGSLGTAAYSFLIRKIGASKILRIQDFLYFCVLHIYCWLCCFSTVAQVSHLK